MTTNKTLLNKTIQHGILLERLSAGEQRMLLKYLQDEVYPDAISKLQKSLVKGVPISATSKRSVGMIKSINNIVGEGINETKSLLTKDLRTLMDAEAAWTAQTIQTTMPIDIIVNAPNIPILRQALKEPFLGDKYDDWYKNLRASSKNEVRRELTVGLTQGETIPQLTTRLEGALKRTDNGVKRIVRTSVNHIANEAREATYAENKDIVDAVQYVATLDGRTTDICMSLDGQVFEINKGPRPPQHHMCRSKTAPVIKGWEELGLKSPPPSTRASLDGQVSETLSGPRWLAGQKEKIQNSVLGKRKAEAWRDAGTPDISFIDAMNKPLSMDQFLKRL